MKIRAGIVDDAPALGRVMVESWLSAHRGQVPEPAWLKRVEEWTPEVSAQGWARVLGDQADGNAPHDVLLVAEDDSGVLQGLLYGSGADDAATATAEVHALYVRPDRHGRGIGTALLRAGARELAELGFATLRISVLTANHPARTFYEALGGNEIGEETVDEEGYTLRVTVYQWPDVTTLVGG